LTKSAEKTSVITSLSESGTSPGGSGDGGMLLFEGGLSGDGGVLLLESGNLLLVANVALHAPAPAFVEALAVATGPRPVGPVVADGVAAAVVDALVLLHVLVALAALTQRVYPARLVDHALVRQAALVRSDTAVVRVEGGQLGRHRLGGAGEGGDGAVDPGQVVAVVAVEGDEEVVLVEHWAVLVRCVVVHLEDGAGVAVSVLLGVLRVDLHHT